MNSRVSNRMATPAGHTAAKPQRVRVYPSPGLQIAIPVEDRRARAGVTHLPASGLAVVLTPYWHRRLADGDVSLSPVPAAPEPMTTPEV